jgi:hypothetical protein
MILKAWYCTGLASKLNTPSFTRWLQDAEVVALQETFLDSCALHVAGFGPYVTCAKPAPAGKHHRATGGLVTLVSAQLASAFRVSSLDSVVFEGFENQCILF